jgi:hypothetical protein
MLIRKSKAVVAKIKCAMKNVSCAHDITHAFYFGLVAFEAHHWYGLAAAILLIFTIVEIAHEA